MRKLGWGVFGLFTLLIASYGLVYGLTDFGDSELKQKLMQLPWVIKVHAIGGGVALVLGLVQIVKRIRVSYPRVHRWVGRFYMVSVIGAGLAGVLMALRADGGLVAQSGFMGLAVFWLVTAVFAWFYAFTGNTSQHRTFVICNYALTWAAVTLRIELPILAMLFGFDTGYQIIAWLCWVPNLIFAIWMTRGRFYFSQRLKGVFNRSKQIA